MTIERIQNGNDLTLAIDGQIDTSTAPKLNEVLHEVMDGTESLTIDCARCNYVSSAGLRLFLIAHTTMAKKGGFTLANVNEQIVEALTITGMMDFIHTEGKI